MFYKILHCYLVDKWDNIDCLDHDMALKSKWLIKILTFAEKGRNVWILNETCTSDISVWTVGWILSMYEAILTCWSVISGQFVTQAVLIAPPSPERFHVELEKYMADTSKQKSAMADEDEEEEEEESEARNWVSSQCA